MALAQVVVEANYLRSYYRKWREPPCRTRTSGAASWEELLLCYQPLGSFSLPHTSVPSVIEKHLSRSSLGCCHPSLRTGLRLMRTMGSQSVRWHCIIRVQCYQRIFIFLRSTDGLRVAAEADLEVPAHIGTSSMLPTSIVSLFGPGIAIWLLHRLKECPIY